MIRKLFLFIGATCLLGIIVWLFAYSAFLGMDNEPSGLNLIQVGETRLYDMKRVVGPLMKKM